MEDYSQIGIKPVVSYGQNFLAGAQVGLERQRMANEQAKLQREELRKDAQNQLYKLAASGNPDAAKQLAMVNPEAAKGLQDYQDHKLMRGGQLLSGVKAADRPYRPALYKQAIVQYTKEFGETPPVPSEYSDDKDMQGYIDSIITQARDVEKVAAENYDRPKQQAEIQNITARTKTEGYQQNKLSADTSKTRMETNKLGEEIGSMKADREAMKAAGFTSPTAYKKYQEASGENLANSKISLPKIEQDANNALQLVDDIVNHEGKSSMVGMKNVFYGAVPFTQDSQPGTPAANFKAKLDQLQGQNFLQAFQSLKGAGAISEIEGKKATQAISDMSTTQSEKEFDKSAKRLKEIIQQGLDRAKKQSGASSGSKEQSNTTLPKMGEVQNGYKFLGGNPGFPSSWGKL